MRCRAMEVFPEPATPWMIRIWASSLRMTAFWSRWMVATMLCMPSSAERASSSWSTSSTTLTELSIISSIER